MAITLKEAFRYQNYLDKIIRDADSYLRDTNNVMVITKTHTCSDFKLYDKVTNNLSDRATSASPEEVIDFMLAVLDEKRCLSDTITDAKTQHCPDMDASLALNKTRQNIINRLKSVIALRPRTSTDLGNAYLFSGTSDEPTQYLYNIEVHSEPDFNKANIKALIKKLSEEADIISTRLDYYVSSVPVNFVPNFDMTESFEDLVEDYVASKVQ